MASTLRLGFTGDVMLGRLVDRRQRSRSVDAVWGDLLDELQSLDGLFINLECAVSREGHPWRRTYRPFHFRGDPRWVVPALERAGVDWVSLANNHALDYEVEALCDTVDRLDQADIAHAGAGRTDAAAREPARLSIDGVEIALFAFTDNTPEYAAGPDSPGVAHVSFDLHDEESRETLTSTIQKAKETNPDIVVASLHWGPNMVTEPSSAFQDVGRWLIEQGVTLVHGHSAHVVHGIEIHDGHPILYDTGDFVDDYAVDETLRNDRGFLFEVCVRRDGIPDELRLIPTEIRDCAVNTASEAATEWSHRRLRERSEPFGTRLARVGDELVASLDDDR
ncbi:CapA family protein [Halocatena pleomorpha]|uniref:CapA family protein n=1 Tax=Halocatena pleomorpha TaxID=1785090 RepID=A0A3P3RJK7_9EURY|nr:CapA family protein [Halocatena pleomorpha]RRJ33691.1 CapA family protein [Halocatena pleomorpha]